MRTLLLFVLAAVGIVAASSVVSCSSHVSPPDWLPETPQARADFDTFAVRCSKCHSLARPLNSGIDDDEYWKIYVDKMRRQPGSGISPSDAMAALRFLHFYAIEQRRKKGLPLDSHNPADDAVDAAPPPFPSAPAAVPSPASAPSAAPSPTRAP